MIKKLILLSLSCSCFMKGPYGRQGLSNRSGPSTTNSAPADFTEQESGRKMATDTDRIYTSVEKMPRFPDGQLAMKNYIKKHLTVPSEAVGKNISQKIYVRFYVDLSGKLCQITALNDLGYHTKEAALKLVKEMPDWMPGEQDGRPVKVWMTVAVDFDFQKKE